MTEETLANGATEAPESSQAEAIKTYTQDEVDNMMARMKGSITKKLLKPYEDLGDPDELRSLKAEAEQKAQAEAIKRGEFEKTLQELAQKKDAEISKRDSIIKEYKVNTPLLDAAARYRAVAPEQVKSLLSGNVRLNEVGDVEVIGKDGSVRYDDKGTALTVDTLVREFLDSNPHFVSATPSTTNTQSSVQAKSPKSDFNLGDLDLSRPEHRKLYAEAKSKGLL